MKKTNRLIHETSPYLLQHAHNPVDWFPWGDEALNRAKKEDKPILVSIGYSACHWCHVMEKESFEDDETAKIMNENFVNIKIDREERPDLDHIYMDAVQSMTGRGGWPLNVFLTPDAKPFYGGTYFPPHRAYNLPSWKEILEAITRMFKEKRNEIDAQAENLTGHLLHANTWGTKKPDEDIFTRETTEEIFNNIMKNADKQWGGFGNAPKFPQTFIILFLLRYYHVTKNKEALNQATLSLDKMIEGGMYDQLGGGFARYSTDSEWLVPHFEKMLYDNALLISVLSEAFQLTKKERYKEVIDETIGFIKREMMPARQSHSGGYPEGGFYSALDADSEGEEGKFYVWTYNEVKEILNEDADIFCEYYDVTPGGNWESKNILRVKKILEDFADEKNISIIGLKNLLESGRRKLLEHRAKRTRPGLDDKFILGWNALMNAACSKAFAATGNEEYRELAVRNMNFLLEKFTAKNSELFHHTWKNNLAKHPAFLEDYAYHIIALIHLQEITADTNWLLKAKAITEYVIDNFTDNETDFFFFTHKDQKDVIIRKKEFYDGAVPSGNSVMAYNLHYLSHIFGINEWEKKAISILLSLGSVISKHPSSFGYFACILLQIIEGTHEIVITGSDFKKINLELMKEYMPHKVLLATDENKQSFPLLVGKDMKKPASIYLCKDFSCLPPVISVKDLISLINNPVKA